MGFKHIMPLLVFAVLVGWFMPAPAPVIAPVQEAVRAQPAPANIAPLTTPTQTAQPQSGVALDRAENGHFYADGDVDGAPVNFMIDTGASVIALTGADAQKLGQTWYPNELQTVGRGANGDVIGKPVMLGRVRIGNLEVNNVRAIIIPEGLDVSLLGQSFLSKIQNVNISGDRMTLG
jgi:aspartyl protease family protein